MAAHCESCAFYDENHTNTGKQAADEGLCRFNPPVSHPAPPAQGHWPVGGKPAWADHPERDAAPLRAGAVATLEQAGASFEVLSVPGALELPVALAMALGSSDRRFAGAVALGCVIRGETYHFEVVCNESARALTALAVAARLPFGNGVLTVESTEQAIERADPRRGDKGGDAARAALALWRVKHGGAT